MYQHISTGLSVQFQIGEHHLRLDSGDVLIMDAMALMHGVEKVFPHSGNSIRYFHWFAVYYAMYYKFEYSFSGALAKCSSFLFNCFL